MNIPNWREDYIRLVSDETDLENAIEEMEANSVWVPQLQSSKLFVEALPSADEVEKFANANGLDVDKTNENKKEGTGLVLCVSERNGSKYNISSSARGTLCETAKLSGTALSRMTPEKVAQTLNNGLEVAKGQTLMLLRYDKVMALHSGTASGYCVMPISELLKITKKSLKTKFGNIQFAQGTHSNTYTTCVWELPEAREKLMQKYQDILKNSVAQNKQIDYMPVCQFSASDTAKSRAFLTPLFRDGNTYIRFVKGVAVKHELKTGQSGVNLFEEEAKKIFAKFDEAYKVIEKMANTEIYNPVNCFIGIVNKLNCGQSLIPRKYADEAREDIELFSLNMPCLSMHDIYVSMCGIAGIARREGAKESVVANIEETVARVLSLNWKDFDIGGTVCWGKN